jgi:HNH endonuclease
MRKFNSRRRIGRCRNVRGANYNGCERQVDEQCGPEGPPEKCEVTLDQSISARLRSVVLDHEDLFCRMCGVIPGDIDDVTGRNVKFHIEHIEDKNLSGKEGLSNLRVLCSTCYQGAKEIKAEKPSGIWLLSQVRRAGQDEQRTVLAALLKKFGEGQ